MQSPLSPAARAVMQERFGRDCLIALATAVGNEPFVRTVNAWYSDGAFYVITHALSGKMAQIAKNPAVAIAGDWLTARGVGENLGPVLAPENAALMHTLRAVFVAWYGNGHVNEADPHTCILRIRLTEGVLFSQGTRYDLRF